MTDSAAYLLNEVVPPSALNAVMQSIFSRSQGIGVSFLRNPMGASDIARTIYSYDDNSADSTNSDLSNFSIAHDETDILPLLIQAKAVNPQIKMMGTPWSPPGWMKTTGVMSGGSLLSTQYTAFANYLVKYLQAYEAAGVPVDYLTIQNEPLNNTTGYPSEYMLASDQLNILKNYVLPALAEANIDTTILVYDHNWDTPSYPETTFGDAVLAASAQIAGVAWHWYGGPPGAMTTLHNLYPQFAQYVTEASGGTWIADEVKTDFEMIIHSMRNWSRSYIKWSLALDQNRGPHLPGGCGTCSGLITIDSNTGTVSNNIDYYTLGHFSKFVLPGAVRVWSNNIPGIVNAAFVNPDRTRVLVAYNDSASPQTFQVVWYGTSFSYTLPAYGGATFEWTGGLRHSCFDPRGSTSANAASPLGPTCWTFAVPATTQIQASSYNEISAAALSEGISTGLQTEPCSDTDGGYDLGYSSPGYWAEYENVDFGAGVHSVQARVANNSGGPATIEFHSDSAVGPLLAQVTIPNTSGWQTWVTTPGIPVSGATGVHNLFLVFQNGSSSGMGNVNWFQFQ